MFSDSFTIVAGFSLSIALGACATPDPAAKPYMTRKASAMLCNQMMKSALPDGKKGEKEHMRKQDCRMMSVRKGRGDSSPSQDKRSSSEQELHADHPR